MTNRRTILGRLPVMTRRWNPDYLDDIVIVPSEATLLRHARGKGTIWVTTPPSNHWRRIVELIEATEAL